MGVLIYHNPQCSKSRNTLEILNEQGIKAELIDYLANPPSEQQLEFILSALKMSARELMRQGELEYKENNLDNADLTEQDLIKMMVKFPILIERPIVISEKDGKKKVAIGRPPESVLDILS